MHKDLAKLALHSGIVEDTKDPLENGRVKVRVLFFDGSTEDNLKPTKDLRWCKVSESLAGWNKDKNWAYGNFHRPQVNDAVWLICESGDPSYRVVIGSYYRFNDKQDSTASRAPIGKRIVEPFKANATIPKDPLSNGVDDVDEKAYSDDSKEPIHFIYKTPKGHMICINEKEDLEQIYIRSNKGHILSMSDEPDNLGVLLQDANKNYVYIDTNNNDIFMRAKRDIKLSAGRDFITVAERDHHNHVYNDQTELVDRDVKRVVGRDVDENIGNDVDRTVGNNITENIIANITRTVGGDVVETITGAWTVSVGAAISFTSATMDIVNSATTATVSNWLWSGSLHTRSGNSVDSGSTSHG